MSSKEFGMRVNRLLSLDSAWVKIVAVALSLIGVAQAAQTESLPRTTIKNFGCVNKNLFRGAQPKQNDYRRLAEAGIKTIVDLQRDGEKEEQEFVEAAGMKFFRIGLSDKSWPSNEQVGQFLRIVDDPANQPVFIHCHGGRHRAGVMTAIYRLTHDGWDADRAYAEMRQYEFESGIGHGGLKDFVYDYFTRMDKRVAATVAK
jgi:tyrosine-protein phosphatase SIW14